jgi:hypothetical protein
MTTVTSAVADGKFRAGLSPHCLNRNPRHAEVRSLTPALAAVPCSGRDPQGHREPSRMGRPRARLQAPTPARADGTPGFLGGKLIEERKAPSAPEHRNWRGSCSDPSPRRQQPRADHPQVLLTSGETSTTDQPGFRNGRVRTRGGPPGPRRAQAIGGHARDISSP